MDLPCDTVGLKQLPVDGVSQETLHGQAALRRPHRSAETERRRPRGEKDRKRPQLHHKAGSAVVMDLIKTIQTNKDYLCEVDSKIGDGDHGLNMNKGFTSPRKSFPGLILT